MARLLITRPARQAAPTRRVLEDLGHEVVVEPLMRIEPAEGVVLDLEGVQAVAVTSANAASALEAPLGKLPVFAVGAASAQALREQGVEVAAVGAGGGRALARLLIGRLDRAGGAILHPCGERTSPGLEEELAAAGFRYRPVRVYRAAAATQLSSRLCSLLQEGGIDHVLLFSPRSAALFEELAEKAGFIGKNLFRSAICLSPGVADALDAERWRAISVALSPSLEGMCIALDGRDTR